MGVILFLALASLDGGAHLLVAHGAAAADLRAPSAAIARVKAERTARERAEKELARKLKELGHKKSVDALLKTAVVKDEQFGSDGSVELTLELELPAPSPKPAAHAPSPRPSAE